MQLKYIASYRRTYLTGYYYSQWSTAVIMETINQ